MIKLTYPAGITKELTDITLRGVKLNGIRPVKIEILDEVAKQFYEDLISRCIVNINQYCGEVYYLGSKVWSRK